MILKLNQPQLNQLLSTQPILILIRPLALLSGIEGIAKKTAEKLRNEGLFTPPSLEGSSHYPSGVGGNNWGGPAIDPERNIMIVNTNNMASLIVMVPREDCNKPLAELAINKTQERFTNMMGLSSGRESKAGVRMLVV